MKGFKIAIGDINIDVDDVFFIPHKNDNKLDLEIYVKNSNIVNDAVINAIFLLLDSAIGEYDVESIIGGVKVDTYHSLQDQKDLQPLCKLPDVVDEMK